jgi:hypothetical protein
MVGALSAISLMHKKASSLAQFQTQKQVKNKQ